LSQVAISVIAIIELTIGGYNPEGMGPQ